MTNHNDLPSMTFKKDQGQFFGAKQWTKQVWFLIGTLSLALVVMLTLYKSMYVLFSEFYEVSERQVQLMELSTLSQFYDEALTMSAKMASITGDKSWVQRYDKLDKELLSVLDKLKTFGNSDVAESTAVANDRLVEIERKSFQFIEVKKIKEAIRILESPEYQKYKLIYSEGVKAQNSERFNMLSSQKQVVMNRLNQLGTISVFMAIGIVALFAYGIRNVQIWSEAKLNQLIDASKMKSLGVLAASIAHEINNAVAAVFGRVEILLSDVKAKDITLVEVETSLIKIKKNVDRVVRIVKSIKSFSRFNASDPLVPVSSMEIVDNCIELVRDRLTDKQVELRPGERAVAVLSCRQSELEQVMLNLLNNSIDAVEKNDTRWISLDAVIRENNLEFIVTDSGKGIAPEVLKRLMEPFFTTKDAGKGTGLGLSISREIVASHDGQLSYFENNGHTSFRVTLPIFQCSVHDKIAA